MAVLTVSSCQQMLHVDLKVAMDRLIEKELDHPDDSNTYLRPFFENETWEQEESDFLFETICSVKVRVKNL